jgi:hypothetical protein
VEEELVLVGLLERKACGQWYRSQVHLLEKSKGMLEHNRYWFLPNR